MSAMTMARLAAFFGILSIVVVGSPFAAEPPIPKPRPSAPAADVAIGQFFLPAGAPEDVVLSGMIADDLPSQFLRVLRVRPGVKRLLLASDGGWVDPALIVAKEVHARGLETRIPAGAGCYSACAFIFLAGATRSIADGGSLGVHQIYGPSDPAAVQVTFSDVFDALRSFGVSDGVISSMLRTPPDGMYVFSREELAALDIVVSPPVASVPQAPLSVTATAETPALPVVDPAFLPGNQSLLLEASDNGTTGAVPFSGTVEWSKGTDEVGLPTLIGTANIPARGLVVDLMIRRNSDSSLPASHLVEINFQLTKGFAGGSIAGLPGILLKNEELIQGTPLVGVSRRLSPNSFEFALSAGSADLAANAELLSTRPWMDLAMVYATGKRAILTLERDEASIRASDLISNVTNSTVVTKRVTIESPQAIERVIAIEKAGYLKEPLLKNGFDTRTFDLISATLKNVLSSTNVPAGARLRILMGPARNSQTLIPHRLSIYFPDPKTGELRHAVTAALTDRGSYVLALEPPAIDVGGSWLGAPPGSINGQGPNGTSDRFRPD